MKIVHAADLHIHSPFRRRAAHGHAARTAFHQGTRKAFSNLLDLCMRRDAALQNVEQVPLDVVRWVPIQVQVRTVDAPEEAAVRVQRALCQARIEAQERPLVTRIVVKPMKAGRASRFDRRACERSVRHLVRGMEHLWVEKVLIIDCVQSVKDANSPAC